MVGRHLLQTKSVSRVFLGQKHHENSINNSNLTFIEDLQFCVLSLHPFSCISHLIMLGTIISRITIYPGFFWMVQIYTYFPEVKLLLTFSTIHNSVTYWKINYMVSLADICISVLNLNCIEVKKICWGHPGSNWKVVNLWLNSYIFITCIEDSENKEQDLLSDLLQVTLYLHMCMTNAIVDIMRKPNTQKWD